MMLKYLIQKKKRANSLGLKNAVLLHVFAANLNVKGGKLNEWAYLHMEKQKTRLHKIWESMRARCYDKNHIHFENYGGRGIYVCGEWSDYVHFRDWALNNGYSEDLTIDRIDVNGDYCPENCRWVTMKEQQNNKRTNRYISMNGETHTISNWSEITGIKKTTLKERLNSGWSVEKALTTPVRKRAKMDLEE